MATFRTYYNTGSVRKGTDRAQTTFHRSKRAAMKEACRLSKFTKGYVTVDRNGIEVGSCFRGKPVK
jgi:hypothetical protein